MMQHEKTNGRPQPSRRQFMQTTAALSAGLFAIGTERGYAQNADPIRVGVIGCGRRGTGAAFDCMKSSQNVQVTALGDLFEDHLKKSRKNLSQMADTFKATDDTCFSGWDAYQKVLACDVDMVILAAPPAFRPLHLKAAIIAGKHVFMEKPVAVDPAGVRTILSVSELAAQKNLGIVAGTQRRHQTNYREVIQRIHGGALGDIVPAACYWIGDYDYYKAVPRKKEWSDMEWQLRNWNYYTWLSGDHIVEQHVHNIDVINWVLQAHPIKAVGMGGRQQRIGTEYGHIYDHFSVEFEYPGGIRVESLCRQMANTYGRVGEYVAGNKGISEPGAFITGPAAYKFEGNASNPYEQEHADLIASIRAGSPLNEGKTIAESTMAAIMGRMSAYTGQEVTWDWAMNESRLDLTPPKYEMGPLPMTHVAIPGECQLI